MIANIDAAPQTSPALNYQRQHHEVDDFADYSGLFWFVVGNQRGFATSGSRLVWRLPAVCDYDELHEHGKPLHVVSDASAA